MQSSFISAAVIVAALVHGPDTTAARAKVSPCYAAVTVVVSEANPYRIKRVVTSGVRRYEDAGGGTPASCTPADGKRFDAATIGVDHRVSESPKNTTEGVEHIVVRSTSSKVAIAHLEAIVAKASASSAGFPGVEVVSLKTPDGVEYEEAPLPRLLENERAHSACTAASNLSQETVSFHWAC